MILKYGRVGEGDCSPPPPTDPDVRNITHPALQEKFRKSFNEAWPGKISHLGTKLHPVTLSLGMAQLTECVKVDKLIMRADLAMYEAKKGGGNRLTVAWTEIGENS